MEAAREGDLREMEEVEVEIIEMANKGHPHAQSVLGFMYEFGVLKERSKGKAFLNHYFAAENGNLQSKMALAYTYYRQDMMEAAREGDLCMSLGGLKERSKGKAFLKIILLRKMGICSRKWEFAAENGIGLHLLSPRLEAWKDTVENITFYILPFVHCTSKYHEFPSENDLRLGMASDIFPLQMHEKAVKLYAELAEVAVNSFLISKDSPVIEPVRIHNGAEENKEALRKSRGEEDEDFQISEYQAQKGNAGAMYKMGIFYYFGLRGIRRDHSKALSWFLKAVEKGEAKSMELLGELYARGAGVERNYTKALEWLTLASKQQHYSAYNGMGYLYAKGYGVDQKNFTKAKEYFEKAADNEEAGGFYNLGVMYLKALGVKRDIKLASKYFIMAANVGQPKAFYQLAKMFQTGVGLKKNIPMATALFKLVAERGPWSALSRWALESYLKGDIGKAFLLYSRMAELGYEVAQSNAAWILDHYGSLGVCIGESGVCSDVERHQRSHSLWWKASEQGNEHAALLIGDAYYYGRGTERDFDRAAEAYLHAKSQSNAQAMFNLGYMHEHGLGLPFDLHLAKRYYDQALEIDAAAKLPVTLALASLWIRKNYAGTFLVHLIDSLPEVYPKVEAWVEDVLMEEGNATILTLFVCLLTVLYLRERHRRQPAAIPAAAEPVHHHQPIEPGAPFIH
ncbi:ubiquitin-protein ligase [Lithospermum erythrorhizon]|uniref:Ubiquitin-protein ligase n=1 Tax=Lithospermum erythrorhizon TaxID=34254 RepID=A0AAV3RMR0_LITER